MAHNLDALCTYLVYKFQDTTISALSTLSIWSTSLIGKMSSYLVEITGAQIGTRRNICIQNIEFLLNSSFIGFDQYMFVTNMRYIELITSTKINLMTAVTWATPILVQVLTYYYSATSNQSYNHSIDIEGFESQPLSLNNKPNTSSNVSTLQPLVSASVICKEQSIDGFVEIRFAFMICNFVFSFLLPTFAIMYFYGKIYQVARESIAVRLLLYIERNNKM